MHFFLFILHIVELSLDSTFVAPDKSTLEDNQWYFIPAYSGALYHTVMPTDNALGMTKHSPKRESVPEAGEGQASSHQVCQPQ